jgi:MinD-like ATPase involved in chromosome partitioning or flagellar assembly
MMWALVSAKGSPGVTTLGLAAVATMAPGEGLLAELDPAGGDVAVWAQSAYEAPGLMALAAAGRRGMTPELVAQYERAVGPGLAVLLGPTDGAQATAALASTSPILAAALASRGGAVFADCGRFGPGAPTTPVLASAETTVLLLRPVPGEIEHARCLVPTLRSVTADVVAVLAGRKPCKPAEVAELLGVEVVGVVDRDVRTAEGLARAANLKALRRAPLVRSAATVLDRLRERTSRPELRAAG